jgi:hypothetical protein
MDMMGRTPLIDLTGKTYGAWTVVGKAEVRDPRGKLLWLCRCKCGETRLVLGQRLRNGHSLSCGCDSPERRIQTLGFRGVTSHPMYQRWSQMVQRCHSPRARAFEDYGARGITVCDRWRFGENGLHGVECYASDMGVQPFPGATVDRRDNDGNYTKSNCRWATSKEQVRNTRTTVRVTIDGETSALADLTERAGLNHGTVYERLRRGWSAKRALAGGKTESNEA